MASGNESGANGRTLWKENLVESRWNYPTQSGYGGYSHPIPFHRFPFNYALIFFLSLCLSLPCCLPASSLIKWNDGVDDARDLMKNCNHVQTDWLRLRFEAGELVSSRWSLFLFSKQWPESPGRWRYFHCSWSVGSHQWFPTSAPRRAFLKTRQIGIQFSFRVSAENCSSLIDCTGLGNRAEYWKTTKKRKKERERENKKPANGNDFFSRQLCLRKWN